MIRDIANGVMGMLTAAGYEPRFSDAPHFEIKITPYFAFDSYFWIEFHGSGVDVLFGPKASVGLVGSWDYADPAFPMVLMDAIDNYQPNWKEKQ